jgi:hypothetical protein
LLILSKQLETALREKDEIRRIVDTLNDKNLILKKKLYTLISNTKVTEKNTLNCVDVEYNVS